MKLFFVFAQKLAVLPLYMNRVDCNNSELTLYRHKLIIHNYTIHIQYKRRRGLARLKWKPNQFNELSMCIIDEC